MSRPPTLYQWADERLEGGLAKFLTDHYDAGDSHEQIAFLLRSHDITVSRETVRRWLASLDGHGGDSEAAAS